MESVNENTTAYSQSEIVSITSEVARAAKSELGDRLCDVILYGSYARGDNKDWSDIDVLILVNADDMETKRIKNLLSDRLWNLIYETNLLLSIVVVSMASYERYKGVLPFYANVAKEGRHVNV